MHQRSRAISKKMNQARIVFMGTPDFALGCLEAIFLQQYNVVGIVTAPDRPAGRRKKLHQSPVKTFALQKDIPLLQPLKLKDPEFLNQLKEWKPDLIIVVAFRMLPKEVWSLPPLGTFNLHASLLPDYRGAAPINWAIIKGESQTGVTTFLIDEAIDTGAVLMQQSVPIESTDDAGILHDKLLDAAKQLIPKTITGLWNETLQPLPQKEPDPKKIAPKLYPENTRINWNDKPQKIQNHIRGLSPYPSAWTLLTQPNAEAVRLKIFKTAWETQTHDYSLGTWVTQGKTLGVALHGGILKILELQWPGKKKMTTQELLNGRSFEAESRVE